MQKRYKKRSELTEKTNMGYPTLADELNIETVNDQLAKVPGFEHMLTYGSKKPRFIDGGGNETLRIESINESVSRITNGMQGSFETKKKISNSITESVEEVVDQMMGNTLVMKQIDDMIDGAEAGIRVALSRDNKTAEQFNVLSKKFFEAMKKNDRNAAIQIGNNLVRAGHGAAFGLKESFLLKNKNTLSEIKDPKKRFSIIKKYGLEDYDNGSWSNPEDWNGDTEFGTCDLTGKQGDLEPMTVMDKKGKIQEFEVLSDVAYQLHGLSGAY